MRVISFVDEDWTGLTHQQIYSQIRSELEEQQCKEDEHKWIPAYYCSVCGLQSEEALTEMTTRIKNKIKSKRRKSK